MKQTKFDSLKNCYIVLSENLNEIDHKLIRDLRSSWDLSFEQIDEFLVTKQITKSKMVPGLLQGLRELPELFSDMPNPERARAMEIYSEATRNLGING